MTSSPPARRFDWNNLRLRVLSGLILAPVAFAVVWLGGWPFLLLIAVASALLAYEWELMSAPSGGRTAFLVTGAVLAPLFLSYLGVVAGAYLALALAALAAALTARFARWSDRSADIAFGVLYIGLPGTVLFWLRHDPGGLPWATTLFGAAWSADTAAYVAGNVLKGPKLWPRFSPNKTWSGFLFGLLGAVSAATLSAYLFRGQGGPDLGAAWWIGLATGLATMAGDLWESMLKRRFGVKDSGDLIPGHGGLLDRVDGLMFAILVVALIRALSSGSAARLAGL